MDSNTNKPTQSQPPPNLKNPLALAGTYNKDSHARFQVDMPKEDYNFFRRIDISKGLMQTLCNILLLKLQTQLKHHGITDISQQPEFREFVANVRITDGREVTRAAESIVYRIEPITAPTIPNGITTNRSVPQTSPPNVGKRKARTPRKDKKHEE